jgi:hypothetical protein
MRADADPIVCLMGCRPWPYPPHSKHTCPVCHGATAKDTRLVVCLECYAVSPPLARLICAREVGRPDHGRREHQRAAENRAKHELARRHTTKLDEKTRRLIWNGYRGVLGHESEDVTNLAKIGRDWLTSIGQEPLWDESEPETITACKAG